MIIRIDYILLICDSYYVDEDTILHIISSFSIIKIYNLNNITYM